MNTAANINQNQGPMTAFRRLTRGFGAKLRRAIELFAAPFMVMGSQYL